VTGVIDFAQEGLQGPAGCARPAAADGAGRRGIVKYLTSWPSKILLVLLNSTITSLSS
jgi:hypothetical protein